MSAAAHNATAGPIEDRGVRALAELGRVRAFGKHAVIIHEGDAADTVFIVLSGRVRVFSSGPDGREIVLDILGPGALLGEMSLDGSPRSGFRETIEPTKVAVVDVRALRERLRTDVDLAMLLVTSLLGATPTAQRRPPLNSSPSVMLRAPFFRADRTAISRPFETFDRRADAAGLGGKDRLFTRHGESDLPRSGKGRIRRGRAPPHHRAEASPEALVARQYDQFGARSAERIDDSAGSIARK